MDVKSVDEILDYAIAREQDAVEFYTDLASKAAKPQMRKVFEEFAREEMGHKTKLTRVKEGKALLPAQKKVADLKIADYVVEVDPNKKLDYQDALILAMKREKASFKLYNDLAAATDDDAVRSTMLALAQEEAKHKLRFEIEYDENILTEN
jgi:rubrerythrin